jgi:hypothetical protein
MIVDRWDVRFCDVLHSVGQTVYGNKKAAISQQNSVSGVHLPHKQTLKCRGLTLVKQDTEQP